jgi:cell division protein FtsB
MSIALWADLEAAKQRIEELEKRLATLGAENIVMAHKIETIEQMLAAKKPGPKPKDNQ